MLPSLPEARDGEAMLRSAGSKTLWVLKGAALFGGAVVTVALVLGVASMAFGANGQPFILGQNNSASLLTRLTGNVDGAAMQVVNNNADADDTALNLQVQDGEAPMRVTSDARVLNFNADYVDGRSFSCPAGTLFHEGVCIERAERGPATYNTANLDCLDEGGRLPTVAELQTFRNRPGTGFDISELTSQRDRDGDQDLVWIVQSEPGDTVPTLIAALWPYRCVVPPS
jgi:hypothetical protein